MIYPPNLFPLSLLINKRNQNPVWGLRNSFFFPSFPFLFLIESFLGSTIFPQSLLFFCVLETRAPRKSAPAVVKDWSKKTNIKAERVNYTAEFTINSNFGEPGAITVANKHQKEFFLESITLEGFASGPVHFPCNSWVQSSKDHPEKRVFFSNQVKRKNSRIPKSPKS